MTPEEHKQLLADVDARYLHQQWCAKVIAANAEVPWTVRCDCKPKKPKKKKHPPEPYRDVGWLGGFDVEPTK